MNLLHSIIRTRLAGTSRSAANAQIRTEADRTIEVANSLGEELAGKPATVPRMPGVDEDMRNWSVLQIIEHNLIVNRVFTEVIATICRGETFVSNLDPKKDVMPSEGTPFSIVADFAESVDHHLETVAKVPELRGVGSFLHPVFGEFDAHKTHAMFGFHLWVHRRQADAVAKRVKEDVIS